MDDKDLAMRLQVVYVERHVVPPSPGNLGSYGTDVLAIPPLDDFMAIAREARRLLIEDATSEAAVVRANFQYYKHAMLGGNVHEEGLRAAIRAALEKP